MNEVNSELSEKKTNWLQRLKDESWEAELLVSAVAIYAILQSFSMLDWLIIQFLDYLNPSQYEIGYFVDVFGFLAVGVLAAMFAIHFAFRAYWIGLVGLNSVFPDYSLEDSAYSPIYTKKLLGILPKLTTSISKVDELCSVIFSAAFGLMLLYGYVTIITILYLILFNVLEGLLPENLTWILWIPLLLFGLIFILGFLISIPANIKKFRENETVQNLYFLFSKWTSYVFYGPLHKSILQITMIFGSNFKRKKGLVKMILLMLSIGVGFASMKLVNSDYRYLLNYDRKQDTTTMQLSFYRENNLNNRFLLNPEINNAVITKSPLSIFIPILEHEVRILREECKLQSMFTMEDKDGTLRAKKNKAYLDCYAQSHLLFLNGVAVKTDFLKTTHPHTGQFGIVAYLDVSGLQKGNNSVKVRKNLTSENTKEWKIPFYYSPNQ
ncbi:hypothetical protein ACFQZJ_03120 [Maribacter chungangensis]|uniref:ABC transporter permease n=1 Tax=Maribacter chungangensis TaxID=1069117 RepID=A0ABW3AZZ4_9FLAO